VSLVDKVDPSAWFTLAICGITLLVIVVDQIRWKRGIRAWRLEIEERAKAARSHMPPAEN
jgi:hypothetical protein